MGRHSLWSAEFTGPQSIINTHTRLSFRTSEGQWPNYVNRQGAAHQQIIGSICIIKFFIYIHVEKEQNCVIFREMEGIIFMLSKLTQTQKNKSSLFLFTCRIQIQTKAMKVDYLRKGRELLLESGQETTGMRAKKMQGKY